MVMTIGERVRLAARRSALGAAGGILLLVGLGFLTAATWLAISVLAGAATASLIVGLAYVGLGAVCLALAQRGRVLSQRVAAAPAPMTARGAGMTEIMAAFAQGLGAGMAARKRPKP